MNINEVVPRAAQAKTLEYLSDTTSHVCIALAPAGGKTFLTAMHMNRNPETKFLILVHTLTLLNQFSDVLTSVEMPHYVYHKANRTIDDHRIVISTYQTFSRVLETMDFTPDVIVVDEVHKFIHSSFFAIIDKYPNARLIGLTGTPMISNGAMSDTFETLYQPASQQELFDSGVLVYPTMVSDTNLDGKTQKILNKDTSKADYQHKTLSSISNQKDVFGVVKAFEKHMAHKENQRTIVFCSSVSHARAVNAEFISKGYASALLVGDPGDDEDREHTEIIEAFRAGHITVLCSMNILVEGFDVPQTACAIMARPTKNVAVATQAYGRALRSSPGKTEATIIDLSNTFLTAATPVEHIDWESLFKGESRKFNPFLDPSFIQEGGRMFDMLSSLSSSVATIPATEGLVGMCDVHGEYIVETGKDDDGKEFYLPCKSCMILNFMKKMQRKKDSLSTSYGIFKNLYYTFQNQLKKITSSMTIDKAVKFSQHFNGIPTDSKKYHSVPYNVHLSICDALGYDLPDEAYRSSNHTDIYYKMCTVFEDIRRDMVSLNRASREVLKNFKDIRGEISVKLNSTIFITEDDTSRQLLSLKPEFVKELQNAKQLLESWSKTEPKVRSHND